MLRISYAIFTELPIVKIPNDKWGEIAPFIVPYLSRMSLERGRSAQKVTIIKNSGQPLLAARYLYLNYLIPFNLRFI